MIVSIKWWTLAKLTNDNTTKFRIYLLKFLYASIFPIPTNWPLSPEFLTITEVLIPPFFSFGFHLKISFGIRWPLHLLHPSSYCSFLQSLSDYIFLFPTYSQLFGLVEFLFIKISVSIFPFSIFKLMIESNILHKLYHSTFCFLFFCII